MKEKQLPSLVGEPLTQKPKEEKAEVFNPGNQVVVSLTKEAQGTMYYRAQR